MRLSDIPAPERRANLLANLAQFSEQLPDAPPQHKPRMWRVVDAALENLWAVLPESRRAELITEIGAARGQSPQAPGAETPAEAGPDQGPR